MGAGKEGRVEWRQPTVLAVAKKLIGGRSHAHLGRQQVLPSPGVKPVRGETDRYVGDQPDLAGRPRELAIDVELLPFVKRHAVGEPAAAGLDPVVARMP